MDRKIKDHVSQLKQGSTRDSLNSKDDSILQEMECVSLQSSSPQVTEVPRAIQISSDHTATVKAEAPPVVKQQVK